VQNGPMNALSMSQHHFTVEGKVQCLRKEDCVGLDVYMNEVGITETPDKIKRTTEVTNQGIFSF